MTLRRVATLLACASLAGSVAAAPSLPAQAPGHRHLAVQRGADDRPDTLRVSVSFSGGQLRILPAADAVLYAADLRYDAERARPTATFDPLRGALEIGTQVGPLLRGMGLHALRHRDRRRGQVSELELRLGRETPVDLAVDVTAAHASIELGGVPTARLRMRASAADASVSFASATAPGLYLMELTARGASLRVTGVAHTGVRRISAHASAAQIELDLRGAWQRELTLDTRATLGDVLVRVPADAGVQVHAQTRLLGKVEGIPSVGGDEYRSHNWDRAERRILITGTATLGSIRIEQMR